MAVRREKVALIGSEQPPVFGTMRRGSVGISVARELKGQGVSTRGEPGLVSGYPRFHAGSVRSEDTRHVLGENLDLCNHRNLLLRRNRTLCCQAGVGQGLFGSGSSARLVGGGLHSRSPNQMRRLHPIHL